MRPSSDQPLPGMDVEFDEVAAALGGEAVERHRVRRCSSRHFVEPPAARPDDRLGGGEAGDRHAERRAAHVVEAGVVEQGDRLGVAAVLAAHAELELRVGLRGRARTPMRTSSPTPLWSIVSNGLRLSRPCSR